MKSRATTYLLLAVVALVWSAVAWKIFAPASGTAPAARPRPPSTPAAPTGADTLRLDYPDPFLKEAARPIAAPRPAVRNLPPRKSPPPKRRQVKIAHLGTVASAGATLHILTLGDAQYELARGESAEGFVLADTDPDSLYLLKDGVRYGVKRCGR